MAEIKEGAPLAPPTPRSDTPSEDETPERPVQVPDYSLEPQPIENGRQPSRPGQPARWEPAPGERDKP